MTEFIMIVGLPASGKSSLAESISKNEDAVILSSDSIREELFGSRRIQIDNSRVFNEMNNRTLRHLKNGKNVLYDATNINSNRRKRLLKTIPNNVYKKCIYMCISKHKCVEMDSQREYMVGEDVIMNMYNKMQIPMYCEGWDEIVVHNTFNIWKYDRKLDFVINNKATFLEVCQFYKGLGLDTSLIDIPQDSKHHTLSVLRHSYYVYEWLYDNYYDKNREVMLISALLHDMCKYECKEFVGENKYATYYNHDNLSAQNVIGILVMNGYDEELALEIATIIQLHMRLSYNDDKKNNNTLLKLVGEDLFMQLKCFRQADILAK